MRDENKVDNNLSSLSDISRRWIVSKCLENGKEF